ncbi:MazG-like family protein [Streptococcus sp.]|uniref:MazG-like family protein n=1 Tax=Streptococcus sp. TaxID=1306 RepID=UPI0028D80758|nr:MazG-like family protein [Streptococcus sp.]MDU4507303.1 MazG-like family protein [Streptococcus sp.]
MPYNHGIFIDTVKLSRRWLLGSISRLEEPTYDGIPALIDKINKWAISHGLDKGNPKVEWMKVTEEVGEIRDVFLKPHDFADPEWSLKDAIGDSIVTLIVLCLQLGYDVEECLTIAYNDIKDRKGVMIDDNFVKIKTRKSASSSDNSASAIAGD